MAMITSERIDQAVNVVVTATRQAATEAFADLESRGVINPGNFQRILAQGGKIAEAVKKTVMTMAAELAENIVGRLRLIPGSTNITIAAIDGKKIIAKATDIFTGYLDPDFRNLGLNIASQATVDTQVHVYEMERDGTFAQIFGGFGENLDRLCLSQAQIVEFVTTQKNWLRTDGYGTFFLFKEKVKGEDKFFVADVFFDVRGHLDVIVCELSGGGVWDVSVDPLSRDFVWPAEYRHRVVVPQLVTSTN